MSLSLALAQIQAPNWWNNPVEPWKSNRKRLNEMAEMREKFIASFSRKRKPATMEQLSKEHDCTIARIRSLSEPFIKSGRLVRGVDAKGKVTLSNGGR